MAEAEHGLITLKFTEEKRPKCPYSGLHMKSNFTKAQRCHQSRPETKATVAVMLNPQ